MVDYYSVLLRAVTAPGAGDAQWRRGIYDRARDMLSSQMRTLRPPPPVAKVAAEQAALEAAIERIESEISWIDRGVATGQGENDNRTAVAVSNEVEPKRTPTPALPRLSGVSWIILAVVAAALGAGGYTFWVKTPQNSAPLPAIKSQAPEAAPRAARASNAAQDGDLAPGVDGGSSDVDLPYDFRRQPTFYRTQQPVGTIIIDKSQHFLYLIRPNNVALRYGIGLGQQCLNLAGLRRIASKAEWPEWQPSADMVKRKLAQPGTLAGGPGNPLGARILELDDGQSRIHGTNAPKTIGSTVAFGCIRLVNDDIADLYNRVQISTAVIISD